MDDAVRILEVSECSGCGLERNHRMSGNDCGPLSGNFGASVLTPFTGIRPDCPLQTRAEYVAEHQPWIPVSEELPKKNGWYPVTVLLNPDDKDGVSDLAMYYATTKTWSWPRVIAWQPLPQPYKVKK